MKKIFLLSIMSLIFLTSCGSKKDKTSSNSSNGNNSNTPAVSEAYTTTPKLLSSVRYLNFNSILSINDGIYAIAQNQSYYFYKNNEFLKLIYEEQFPLMSISSNGSTTCETYFYQGLNRPRSACYGKNKNGDLGNGSNIDSEVPTLIGQTEFVFDKIVVTKNNFICGLATDAKIYCWGKNAVKDGESLKDAVFPVEVANFKDIYSIQNLSEIVQISVMNDNICYIRRDTNTNGIWCFNIYNPVHSVAPLISGNFYSISSDGSNTCALDSDGYAWCFGSNRFGELGDGSNIDSAKPVRVKLVSNFKSISVSEHTTCAVTNNNEAYCWGRGDESQLGNGTLKNSNIPVKVSNINYFSSIKTSEHNTCAIDINSKIWCWGKGSWN